MKKIWKQEFDDFFRRRNPSLFKEYFQSNTFRFITLAGFENEYAISHYLTVEGSIQTQFHSILEGFLSLKKIQLWKLIEKNSTMILFGTN
jgi:hypothetical protein